MDYAGSCIEYIKQINVSSIFLPIIRILANTKNTRQLPSREFLFPSLLWLFEKDSQLSNKRLFMDVVSNSINRLISLALYRFMILGSLFHRLPPDVLPIRVACKAVREIADDDKEIL